MQLIIFVNDTVIVCDTFVQPDTTESVIKSIWQTLNDNMLYLSPKANWFYSKTYKTD